MPETGVITAIQGSRVIIKQDKLPENACFGCMNQECRQKEGFISAVNPLALPLEPGQRVETEIRPVALAAQALKALLPPALGFSAGFFLCVALFPVAGESAAAFAGFLLMLASGMVVYLFRCCFPAKVLPKILRVVSPEYHEKSKRGCSVSMSGTCAYARQNTL